VTVSHDVSIFLATPTIQDHLLLSSFLIFFRVILWDYYRTTYLIISYQLPSSPHPKATDQPLGNAILFIITPAHDAT